MMPVAMPFIMYGLSRTLITRREILGTLVAIAGVVALTGPNLRIGGESLAGDLMCLLAMILLSLYLALAAKNNRQGSVWLYVVPLYWVAGLTAFAVFLGTSLIVGSGGATAIPNPAVSFSLLKEALLAVYLGVFPTIVGHTIFNRSMRVLPSQLVSIAILSQFIFAGLIAYLVFGEAPEPLWYPAAILVIAGAVLVITGKKIRSNSEVDG
jgi:drug/metabolite transporter (DMT)-like permease